MKKVHRFSLLIALFTLLAGCDGSTSGSGDSSDVALADGSGDATTDATNPDERGDTADDGEMDVGGESMLLEGFGEPDDGITCSNSASGDHVSTDQYRDIAVGPEHVCGVTVDGAVNCWGEDAEGQASPPSGSFQKVFVAERYSCALGTDGSPTCWGAGYEGSRYVVEPPADATFYTLAVNNDIACGLSKPSGRIQCWWSKRNVVHGSAEPPYSIDQKVPDGRFGRLEAGDGYVCGLRKEPSGDSNLECWGSDDANVDQAPSGQFMDLAVGTFNACAADRAGEWHCWGPNHDTAPERAFVDATSGGESCGLTQSGELQCWGEQDEGNRDFYAGLPSGCFEEVGTGQYHYGCGIRGDGRIRCWGANTAGQLDIP